MQKLRKYNYSEKSIQIWTWGLKKQSAKDPIPQNISYKIQKFSQMAKENVKGLELERDIPEREK
ncbi:hypothetical protein CFP56_013377 [Quercus suber]|uniref:Uncharacterized protein n=1 Tax=Quercus suber TaxID=58331 RepID=A0AAW0KW18_QUESU